MRAKCMTTTIAELTFGKVYYVELSELYGDCYQVVNDRCILAHYLETNFQEIPENVAEWA
jgi:hypothetical protein